MWRPVQERTKGTTIKMKELRVKVRSYDATLVDSTSKKITEAAKTEGVNVKGPVPLPTKREVFTILRSVHVNKKSREQFEMRTHKRLIILENPSEKMVDLLKRMALPAGVEIEVITK